MPKGRATKLEKFIITEFEKCNLDKDSGYAQLKDDFKTMTLDDFKTKDKLKAYHRIMAFGAMEILRHFKGNNLLF